MNSQILRHLSEITSNQKEAPERWMMAEWIESENRETSPSACMLYGSPNDCQLLSFKLDGWEGGQKNGITHLLWNVGVLRPFFLFQCEPLVLSGRRNVIGVEQCTSKVINYFDRILCTGVCRNSIFFNLRIFRIFLIQLIEN